MEHPGSLDITWNEEAFRKLERASAGLRPGKDRIAVVLRGTILSTPLFQGMPSRTTLIPGLGDDSRLDALCRAINNTRLPLTEQQKRHVRENVALFQSIRAAGNWNSIFFRNFCRENPSA